MAKINLLILLLNIFATSNCFLLQDESEGNSTDLPLPHIIIIGATGAGKSSLANVFIGEDPTCENCTFPVCSGADSCTKETTYAVRPWLGEGLEFTVVDTPGFGDSDKEDSVLIDEMMKVLKETVKSANVLFLVLDGTQERLSDHLQQMMREMRALFGESMWNNMLVGVSKWSFAEYEVEQRNRTCILTPSKCRDEETYSANMMNAIESKFHVGKNLTFAFIDSWAKHPMNIDDELQQEAFERESSILWDFATTTPEFEFKSIQDVLDENNDLKAELKYVKGVLDNNITEILNSLSATNENIFNFKAETNSRFEEMDVTDTNTLSLVQENTEKINTNSLKIGENANIITQVDQKVKDMDILPLGTILAWKQLDVMYPENWIECDGREIFKGPWAGRRTPNINNEGRFLRGGYPGNAFETQEDAIRSHTHQYQKAGWEYDNDHHMGGKNGATHEFVHLNVDTGVNYGAAEETRPKNIKVTFIMKVYSLSQN